MRSYLKFLYPGMQLKRWLALIAVGIALVGLGLGYLMTQVYRTQPFPEWVGYLTLQFIDRPIRGFMFIALGVAVCGLAIIQLNRSVLAPFLSDGHDNILDIIHQHRSRQRGPKIVAIGGGTGLSTLLRGLKEYTGNLTAIVTVSDDGGSSGRLRQELGILPPGDFRQCLVALADVEPLMTRLFQYRFTEGDSLEGHSFGNLFIAAMTAITGNFERGLRESSRVLAVRGQIIPSSLENLTLCAEFDDDATIDGESSIHLQQKRIRRVFFRPSHPAAHPEAMRAILDADLIVIGPGSLFTSVLPNFLVEDISRSVKSSRAAKVFVCNVANEAGETDGYHVADHVRAFENHVGRGLFQYILVNNNTQVNQSSSAVSRLVTDRDELSDIGYNVVPADVIDNEEPRRHNPKKLAQSILRIYYDRDRFFTTSRGSAGDPEGDRALAKSGS